MTSQRNTATAPRKQPGDIKQLSETSRILQTGERSSDREIQELRTCRLCPAQQWMPLLLEGRHTPTGWYVTEPATDHTIAFCPQHAAKGRSIAEELSRKINTLIDQALDQALDQGKRVRKEAIRAVRPYGAPHGRNPAGTYSHRVAQWLAALPSGKTSLYWARKKRMFPELTAQQGKLNFPDLIELRVWTIMFRHVDLIWSEVTGLWHKAADILQTPYPFSGQRFLQDPQSVADHYPTSQEGPMEHPRLKRLLESLTYQDDLPVRWNITKDLGMDNEDTDVIADARILMGQAHLEGTNATLEQITKREERDPYTAAGELGITTSQILTAKQVNILLSIPGWPGPRFTGITETGP